MLPHPVNTLSASAANRSHALLRRSVTPLVFVGACLALSGCIPASGGPAPSPTSAPAPTQPPAVPVPQQPAPPVPPASSNWRDIPLSAGEWRYVPAATGGYASFLTPQGANLATLRCVPAQGAVTLTMAGNSPSIRVLTDSQQRSLPASVSNGAVTASLAPRDNLLDAMMFSRGRFVLEPAGQRAVALPAWPEIARVAEDCR